ncbi:hypothetical protein TraAM80_09058 [Trypanosoma rangeli]|uniref:Uncharacterized protein n=1 Tax=Trypanosoma rangeli TaxID=5698 RepID=A0A3R7LIL8_TRYRA|nr:uncharacterized protein TraAM80_09058 [Trypanosoma rangeli]RNE97954.1 hypothetical protein TraAM80_09058 [Trypanosoma rangeli]|eukprot:RNE97954.1 hypothetical protein TraAM80_09058 [Trypanosoma rangeli]
MTTLRLPLLGALDNGSEGAVVPTGTKVASEVRVGRAARLGDLNSSNQVAFSPSSQDEVKTNFSFVSRISKNIEKVDATAVSRSKMLSPSLKEKAVTRKDKIKRIESFMAVSCAGHVPEQQRWANIRKVLDDLGLLEPSLSGIILSLRRYLKDLLTETESVQESLRSEIRNVEERTFKKCEDFLESRVLQVLRDKRKAEATAKHLREEVLKLRRERDDDLMKAKEDVMIRLNDCERKEDEFRLFRTLIASVFKTNEGLVNRIDDLEALLRKHRIEVPRVNEDLYAYSKPKGETSAPQHVTDEVKKIRDQVSLEFMKASREEMNLARLSLQRELLNNAFDDRTAYRLQVNGLRNENLSLQTQIDALQNQVLGLEKYIHEKRFASSGGDSDEVPLTPRPRDVPFAIQTDLGIDLRNSTAQIVAELAAVGANLKHQLNSAVMTLRQLSSAVEWMEDETMLKIADDTNTRGVIPTFPTSAWATIPHFLRTHVGPEVTNLRWTETGIAFLLSVFFSNYDSLRTACRSVRDSKMLYPRQYQLFERCQHLLVRLDASLDETQRDENNVPFGYVVSHFVSTMLVMRTEDSPYSGLLQPGTLNPSYPSGGKVTPVEMEFGKYSYNIWYAAQRYKDQQPLCRLFVDVVDGRLPVKIFEVTRHVLRVVENRIRKFDVDGSGLFTYNKLVSSVLKLVADMDAQVGRCAILAVTETFQANQAPLIGGRVFISSILADETCVEKNAISWNQSRRSFADSRFQKSRGSEEPQGASVLTRFWRRLVIQRYERGYRLMERILGPLVVESQVVVGVFLLPIPSALEAVRKFDSQCGTMTEEEFNTNFPMFPENKVSGEGNWNLLSETQQVPPLLTNEYANLLAGRKPTLREGKGILMEGLLRTTLEGVPVISRSMHFPTHEKEGSETDAIRTPVVSEDETLKSSPVRTALARKNGIPRGKRAKAKAERKSKAATARVEESSKANVSTSSLPEIIPSAMMINADKELVEWYGFCATLRQSLLNFNETIFNDGNLQGEGVQSSNKNTALPELHAEELSISTH